MKRLFASVLLIVVLSLPAIAVPSVVATHAVLAEIASRVGGDQIEATAIIPSGFCPGHDDLSPCDYAALIQTDLVLYSEFEPWVEQLEGRTQPGARVEMGGLWNTPAAAQHQTETLAALLSERTPVVCMQWQESFVSWLGFDVAVSYGLPENLSLRDLVELANEGRDAGATLVIDNLQSGIEFGGKLTCEVNAVHVVLSNFPGALPNTATLIDLLVRNAEALFTAIEPIE